ncbi:hypothetical protein EUZ85_30815 [Hahella sp. KA22]|uniref:hypothetical protein n=1 Tax=Hahella sp. KA22 TaxID=1628392 RepID=UPI000FDE764C|nr:hypothetical protein [Hahella sp. KA22]AZZ94872.1 hypothetical protein ENC22_28230 [Hahella sp. KA22]QAY58245.1 hypothetical protein EUZ85_30815 [Hahella sp. KA22]
MLLLLLLCILIGIVLGFGAGKVARSSNQGILIDMGTGAIGAAIGGGAYSTFSIAGAALYTTYSLLAAATGAVILLLVCHGVYYAIAHSSDHTTPPKTH